MSQYWTDTTEPFMVVVKRPLPKKPKWFTSELLLVNPTTSDMIDVRVDTGGNHSDPDMGVIEAKGTEKLFERIAPGTSAFIEDPDPEEYNEFIVSFDVRYVSDGVAKILHFSADKGKYGVDIAEVPVVGGEGELLQRWDFPKFDESGQLIEHEDKR